MSELVKCLPAVDVIEKHLQAIPHPTAGPNGAPAVLKLVQFAHQSPGLARLRRQIAEGIVMLLEKDPQVVQAFAELWDERP